MWSDSLYSRGNCRCRWRLMLPFPAEEKKDFDVGGIKTLTPATVRGFRSVCCRSCTESCREPLCFGRTSGSHLVCKDAKLSAKKWWVIMERRRGGADGRSWCLSRHGRGFFHLGGRWSTSEINQSGVLTRDSRERLLGRDKVTDSIFYLPVSYLSFFLFFNNWIFLKPPEYMNGTLWSWYIF